VSLAPMVWTVNLAQTVRLVQTPPKAAMVA
jgi:hypothetical protein